MALPGTEARNMELRHIRYFLAVAEEGNFTRAAARLGIGQPPLSQQVKDLEREVGAALFHRVPHGAELTEAGRAFMDRVRPFPALAQQALDSARRAARGELGSLRAGFTSSSAFNPAVAGAIRSFRRAYPEVDLGLVESNSIPLLAALEGGEVDIIFLRTDPPPGGPVQTRLLAVEPMVAVLPAGHPAAGTPVLDLGRLRDDPFILFPKGAGPSMFETTMAACRAAGFEPRLYQTAPQMSSIVNLVAAELGVSIMPASMSQVRVAGVVFLPLAPLPGVAQPTARLALAWRRGDTRVLVRNFINHAGPAVAEPQGMDETFPPAL
ncbi:MULTISPECIES: LysR family transcriptional regulator [Nitrospirillum]|nr:LysR family transcriptional regulator [Nitrospirillum amazonense]MEC4591507.1 LysR family transcriptional regulator [Nitrospirillum amazonense]